MFVKLHMHLVLMFSDKYPCYITLSSFVYANFNISENINLVFVYISIIPYIDAGQKVNPITFDLFYL